MSNMAKVLTWKFPGVNWRCDDDGTGQANVITRFDGGIPSQADQDKWTKEYEEYVSANAYKAKRKAEYDQLNQYEMMFDDKRDGTTTWVDKINEIKSRYPK